MKDPWWNFSLMILAWIFWLDILFFFQAFGDFAYFSLRALLFKLNATYGIWEWGNTCNLSEISAVGSRCLQLRRDLIWVMSKVIMLWEESHVFVSAVQMIRHPQMMRELVPLSATCFLLFIEVSSIFFSCLTVLYHMLNVRGIRHQVCQIWLEFWHMRCLLWIQGVWLDS